MSNYWSQMGGSMDGRREDERWMTEGWVHGWMRGWTPGKWCYLVNGCRACAGRSSLTSSTSIGFMAVSRLHLIWSARRHEQAESAGSDQNWADSPPDSVWNVFRGRASHLLGLLVEVLCSVSERWLVSECVENERNASVIWRCTERCVCIRCVCRWKFLSKL